MKGAACGSPLFLVVALQPAQKSELINLPLQFGFSASGRKRPLSGGMALPYGRAMHRRITIALWLLFTSSSALACSPPQGEVELSSAEISKITHERIERSDAIIDALVVQTKEGAFFLKPFKVWKGKPRRLYSIGNSDCDVSLVAGSKVRALLEGNSSSWMMMAPLYNRKMGTRLFDSIVDASLHHARPKDFENGSLPYPPVP
ncbi:hypothetical protein [Sphingobium aromaticiconvertens]|uniref:hypothetical protein n=1 Tax=Sphingobium aromaticiconvertens TaxID=365341 RepID=UPI0030167857